MQVSDKLIKPLTEAKYLNADNVSRYRCIMRIFFEHYEKLKYWLYQEEVYEEMMKDPFFADYRPDVYKRQHICRENAVRKNDLEYFCFCL